MLSVSILPASIATLLMSFLALAAKGQNIAKFDELVGKLERDVLELRDVVENLYRFRCAPQVFAACNRSNYHECVTGSPNLVCGEGVGFAFPQCGTGEAGGCSSLWDFEHSYARFPEFYSQDTLYNIDPTIHPRVIESICFSQDLDRWFVDKYNADISYWKQMGVDSPNTMYFGSDTGAYRLYPGYHANECGQYDPRRRPWYIAAGSGPKNIVLVLDLSGSMLHQGTLTLMKAAAKQIVSSLTIGDTAAIVTFNSTAQLYANDGKFLYRATSENKEILLNLIDGFEAIGGTNFVAAFDEVFDVLETSFQNEVANNCHTAILFLTDGQATEPAGPNITQADRDEIASDAITKGIARLKETYAPSREILLFTYSISALTDQVVHRFPRQIACAVDGYWSLITSSSEILESLTSYYAVFSFGIGQQSNEDFVAWVEPYVYESSGLVGSTVSAPVFDRQKDPALFLGVVGVDFYLPAFSGAGNDESFRELAELSVAFCPVMNLTTCAKESFRRRGARGDAALCTDECNEEDFVDIEEQKCTGNPLYPRDLFTERIHDQGDPFTERSCCSVDDDDNATKACPEPSTTNDDNANVGGASSESTNNPNAFQGGVLVGIVAGSAILLMGLIIGGFVFRGSSSSPSVSTSEQAIIPVTQLVPMPSPSAPVETPA